MFIDNVNWDSDAANRNKVAMTFDIADNKTEQVQINLGAEDLFLFISVFSWNSLEASLKRTFLCIIKQILIC